ncbi:MAG: TIGR03086 family protein [Actinophytocola sp.]|uniref:TIGR03086 family metal-binding protein n=1 Tax=Actinophytocola sp. TaxID=1872138 RepID=UPI0013210EA7|nr:TIGR03086 family metal-binding protein [Actinophytocola sp.]MPZ83273.1 TIGR03086 family protein [Actinophytocola sp.]
METMERYQRAQDGFDAVLATVPADRWDAPSMCAEWTVRDVAGHVVWGQEQLRAWATGDEYTVFAGAPGAPHPGEMAGDDPVATFREARAAAEATLTRDTLDRLTAIPGLGEVPVSAVVTLLTTDHLAHAWDIGHAVGSTGRLDRSLIPGSLEWARHNVMRRPGFFGPELTPPADADEETRWLAFLGRAAWQRVPS